MRRLVELGNSHDAGELVRRLNDASLTAIYTEAPFLEGELAVNRSIVWIGEDDDMTVAARVLDVFRAEASASRGATCNGCGYDLRGHSGEGRCPECGWRFQRSDRLPHVDGEARDVACPSCGEEVPQNFECCWNCGSAMSGESSGGL